MRQAISLVTILAFVAASSAGCVRQTHFPPEQIARLRPLMQGEPPQTESVVLHGDYPARVHGYTDLDLVVAHRGRILRFAVTPARLAWRTDGLWVDETYLPAHEADVYHGARAGAALH